MRNTDNPFSLAFGKKPTLLIDRLEQKDLVEETFLSKNPATQIYIISGVRGSGKTVLLTTLMNDFIDKEDWVVVELNPNGDLLNELAAQLYEHPELKKIFNKFKINFSAWGFGVSFENEKMIADIQIAIDRMLDTISKNNKKVLIVIDEVTNNENVKLFTSAFQIYIRKNYPLFMLMTGLHENIRSLQDVDTLTFLYRAPKIDMKPLSNRSMASRYMRVFDIDMDEALEMAKFTKGYPYAFQVLGYLMWRNGGKLEDVADMFDEYMEQYVYEKIWNELSNGDRKVLLAIFELGDKAKTADIQKLSGNTSSTYSTYRRRLIQKGLIAQNGYGYVELTLPHFGEIVTKL